MRKTIAALLLAASTIAAAQTQSAAPAKDTADAKASLKFVVIITRHGVRSPTGKLDTLNRYSRQPWPTWSVPPGYLTEHGAQLMTIFGAYDRALLALQGLLSAQGCGDASHIRIVADSDQRTRETGKSLAAGIAPGCNVSIAYLPEGTPDPLFHSLEAGVGSPDRDVASSAILGRVGGQPQALADAYRPQLQKLDAILHGCGKSPAADPPGDSEPASIFSVPSSVAPGNAGHSAEFRSPISVASTITENFLLEYTEGMDAQNVGWGCVDEETLRGLLQLHVAAEDISARTPYIARAQASNLISHVLASLQQAVLQHTVPGALSKPDDRLLILVGHDTNLANIAGALGISWLIDGRRDDTPPGSALVFELWRRAATHDYTVRVRYTTQTLGQMRSLTTLTLDNPPQSVPVFVPRCSGKDFSCDWKSFVSAGKDAINPAFVR